MRSRQCAPCVICVGVRLCAHCHGLGSGIVDIEDTCAGLAIDECTIGAALQIALRELQVTPEGAGPAETEETAGGEAAHPHRRHRYGLPRRRRERLRPDADVMSSTNPRGGSTKTPQEQAARIVNRTLALLKQPVKPAIRAERPLRGADLRPKAQGAIVRSLDSTVPTTNAGGNSNSRRSPAPAPSPAMRSSDAFVSSSTRTATRQLAPNRLADSPYEGARRKRTYAARCRLHPSARRPRRTSSDVEWLVQLGCAPRRWRTQSPPRCQQ